MRRLRLSASPAALLRGRALPWTLFALALASALAFWWLWRGERSEEARRAEVEAVSTRFVEALTTFSGATIHRDVERIRSFATGGFADEVDETFSDERIRAIRESEARSVGEVRSVFVQDLEGDTAEVFAVVDETVSNASAPAPRTDILRIELQLIETTEGWRVSRVDVLQSPAGDVAG